jgi:nitrite reductase/ring-hydroxylating ferredoxin subunit
MSEGLVRLCRTDEVADGEARGFDPWHSGRDSVFVVNHHGRLRAWRDACPHYGDVPMAWRKNAYLNLERTRIVCAAHGAQFDIETGLCTLGPCLGQWLQGLELTITSENDLYIRRWGGADQSGAVASDR